MLSDPDLPGGMLADVVKGIAEVGAVAIVGDVGGDLGVVVFKVAVAGAGADDEATDLQPCSTSPIS